jgi:hypothetical protein
VLLRLPPATSLPALLLSPPLSLTASSTSTSTDGSLYKHILRVLSKTKPPKSLVRVLVGYLRSSQVYTAAAARVLSRIVVRLPSAVLDDNNNKQEIVRECVACLNNNSDVEVVDAAIGLLASLARSLLQQRGAGTLQVMQPVLGALGACSGFVDIKRQGRELALMLMTRDSGATPANWPSSDFEGMPNIVAPDKFWARACLGLVCEHGALEVAGFLRHCGAAEAAIEALYAKARGEEKGEEVGDLVRLLDVSVSTVGLESNQKLVAGLLWVKEQAEVDLDTMRIAHGLLKAMLK